MEMVVPRCIQFVSLSQAPLFKKYGKYVKNFNHANELVDELVKKQPAVKDFMEVCFQSSFALLLLASLRAYDLTVPLRKHERQEVQTKA